jgi:hypothetical protein
MGGLLCKAIEAEHQASANNNHGCTSRSYDFAFDANSLDSGSRSRGVGNNERIKAIFFCHLGVLLFAVALKPRLRPATKGTNSHKRLWAY